jgi:phosphomannomutase
VSDLRGLAEEWLAQDPDAETRAELRALLAVDGEDGEEALRARFGAKLEFGTAGLRGELGAGPNRMNRVTVMRAAAGLAKVLGPGRHVVIGYDARHKSDVFARDTAAVLSGAELHASVLPRPLPTPVLAFAVRHLAADAGVTVTASHNPPRDNGYKVYWGDGAQIVPPVDAEISAAIDAVSRVDELPLGAPDIGSSFEEAALDRPAGSWVTLGDDIVDAYLDAVTALPLGDHRDVRVAYTPLHGVGAATLVAAFERAGFPAPSVVEEQAAPDPDFPTVAFPNPEEPGAMDLALALGERVEADIVLANDPDADRCAVAVRLPGGRFRMLTGDEVGGLLAEHVLTHTSGTDRLVATTIVSSSLLGRIAAAHGVRHAETLTGFKWIMRAGEGIVFGYEEALGYCVGSDNGTPVRDKDGIGAALSIAGLAATAKSTGRSLLDLLDDQAARYGLHATGQLSFRVGDLTLIADAMLRLRTAPPTELAGREVESVEDLGAGVGGLPPTEGLRFRLAGDARIVVRPSGTEPKLKCYLEVLVPVTGTVAQARSQSTGDLSTLKTALAAAIGL